MKCKRLYKCIKEVLPKYADEGELWDYVLQVASIMGDDMYGILLRRLGDEFADEVRKCVLPDDRLARAVVEYLTGKSPSEVKDTDDLGV